MEKKVLTLDSDAKIEVKPFELTDFSGVTTCTFRTPTLDGKKRETTRSQPQMELSRKDRRFQMDPALRDLMSVDEDTDAEIEIRVARRIEELKAQAESEAQKKGYEAGFIAGKEESNTTFSKESNERIVQLDRLIAGFESSKNDVFHANERFLLEVVFRIASSILQREILIDKEYLARVIRTVVEKVGVKEQLKLIANQSQMDLLYGLLPELEKKHSSLKNITIEQSSTLEKFDVVIETDWNRIDATLNTQLGSLHELVLTILEDKQNQTSESA